MKDNVKKDNVKKDKAIKDKVSKGQVRATDKSKKGATKPKKTSEDVGMKETTDQGKWSALWKNPAFLKAGLFVSMTLNVGLAVLLVLQPAHLEGFQAPEDKKTHQELLTGWKPYAIKEEEGQEETESTLPEEKEESTEEATSSKEESSESKETVIEEEKKPSTSVEETNEESDSEGLSDDSEKDEKIEVSEGFSIEPISKTLQKTLDELASPDPSVITYEQLRLVKVLYWGFDNQTHMGELIVHESVAEEVAEIFQEVYVVFYPIEKIRLISEYKNSDEASMEDNNTSAFNYRTVTNGGNLSMHAYGLAIDVNPKLNPYVSEDYVLPENAMAYVDREQSIPGMVQEGDALHQAFTSRGWEWGGDWDSLKDYQHFSKPMDH